MCRVFRRIFRRAFNRVFRRVFGRVFRKAFGRAFRRALGISWFLQYVEYLEKCFVECLERRLYSFTIFIILRATTTFNCVML